MRKDLTYYMNLNYKMEIVAIPEEKGGGYEASIPQLGKYAFIGTGESPEEALIDLIATKREYFEEFIKKGIEVPEPEEDRQFRGEFLLRMPKAMHKGLHEAAKRNGLSLNAYINYLLAMNFQMQTIETSLKKCFDELWSKIWDIPSVYVPSLTCDLRGWKEGEEKAIGA